MGLLDGLMNSFSDEVVGNISEKLGVNEELTKSALGSLLPILLNSVSKKGNNDSGGLGGFVGLLDMDKDGSILDDVAGFVAAQLKKIFE